MCKYKLVLIAGFILASSSIQLSHADCNVSWNDIPKYHSLLSGADEPHGFRDLFYHSKHKRLYINLYAPPNNKVLAQYDWENNTVLGLKIDTNDELMHLTGWGEDAYGNLIAYTDDVPGKRFGVFDGKGHWTSFSDSSKKYKLYPANIFNFSDDSSIFFVSVFNQDSDSQQVLNKGSLVSKAGALGQMIGLYATWDSAKKTYVLSDDQRAYVTVPPVNPISPGASAIRPKAMPTKDTLLVDVCIHAVNLECNQYRLDKRGKDYLTVSDDSEAESFQGPQAALVGSRGNITAPSFLYLGKNNGSIFELALSSFHTKMPVGRPLFINHENSKMAALDKVYGCETYIRDFGSHGSYIFRYCQSQTINSWIAFKPAGQETGTELDIISFLKARGSHDDMSDASNIQVVDMFIDDKGELSILGRAEVKEQFDSVSKFFRADCSFPEIY